MYEQHLFLNTQLELSTWNITIYSYIYFVLKKKDKSWTHLVKKAPIYISPPNRYLLVSKTQTLKKTIVITSTSHLYTDRQTSTLVWFEYFLLLSGLSNVVHGHWNGRRLNQKLWKINILSRWRGVGPLYGEKHTRVGDLFY